MSRLVVFAAVLGQGIAAAAAESPSRFLLVTNWYATFTHKLAEDGHQDYYDSNLKQNCSASWHFHHDISVSCRLVPDPTSIGHPYYRQFIYKQTDAATIHMEDTFDQTCVDESGDSSYQGFVLRDVGVAPTNFVLMIDTSLNSYSLGWVGVAPPDEVEQKYDNITVPGFGNASWSPEALTSNALPASGMTLSGQTSYPMNDKYAVITPASLPFIAGDRRIGGTSPLNPDQLQSKLILTWALTPQLEELEVVVEPEQYQDWLPEGNLQDQEQRGNTIKIHAELQKKGGGAPISVAQQFVFELLNVSKEPGVCMNWPAADKAGTGPDFKFEQDENLPPQVPQVLDVTDTRATTVGEPCTNADAVVSCFDYGASALIKVTASVSGKEIVGYLKSDPAKALTEIPLPRRTLPSLVADSWKKTNYVASLPDDDDSEQDPPGDEHQGDGLTLFEEYRGFSIQGQHTRTSPKKTDLFVLNEGGTDGGLGATMLASASKIKVRRLNPDEFGKKADNSYSRIVNFNHSGSAPHATDQHGIHIVMRKEELGYDEAVNESGVDQPDTPGTKARVELEPGNKFKSRKVGSYGVHSDGTVSASVLARFSYYGASAAHELAHCCCVYHHSDQYGSDDPQPMLVARAVDRTNGVYVVILGNADQTVFLLNEDGSPRDERPGSQYGIGRKHGNNSGSDQCFMRYDNSNGYASNQDPGGTLYLLNQPELAGFSLCDSPAGTGVNAAVEGLPWPRYGAADEANKRGNCKGQLCVNDKYAGNPAHHR